MALNIPKLQHYIHEQDELLIIILAAYKMLKQRRRKTSRKHRWWVHSLLLNKHKFSGPSLAWSMCLNTKGEPGEAPLFDVTWRILPVRMNAAAVSIATWSDRELPLPHPDVWLQPHPDIWNQAYRNQPVGFLLLLPLLLYKWNPSLPL